MADGILSRIGESFQTGALGSLVTGGQAAAQGVDASVIRSQRADLALREQNVAANQTAIEKQQRIEGLQNTIAAGGEGTQQAANELIALDPGLSKQFTEAAGLNTDAQRTEARNFLREIENLSPAEQDIRASQRDVDLRAQGRDSSDTLSLLNMTPEERAATIPTMIAALTPLDQLLGNQRLSAGEREFNALVEAGQLTTEDEKLAARVQLGLDPRAGISAQERIATDPTLTTQVAGSQADIAGATAGAKSEAQIAADLRNAGATATAAAEQAALVSRAQEGEKIKASRVRTEDDAKILLPESEAGATQMITLLSDIRNDPELPNVLGAIEGRISVRLDPNETALIAKIDQVLGKTFLEAYQSLKGGGPITDREGQAATEAQSRLTNRAVSLPAYQTAIDELIDITNDRITRLRAKAGVAAPVAPTAPAEPTETADFDPSLLEFMTPEQRALFE